MHIPTFLLCFFAVGVPLTFAVRALCRSCKESNGNLRSPVFLLVLAITLAVSFLVARYASPLVEDGECRPAGSSIYNDC